MTTMTSCCCEDPCTSAVCPTNEGCHELADALVDQGRSYGLLSSLFAREVTVELLARLRVAKYPASTGNDRLDRGYRELCRYLNGSWERTRGELAVDYFRTFIGNTQDVEQVAFPYESVYTSPDHLLMQDARHRQHPGRGAGGVSLRVGLHLARPPAHAGRPRRGAGGLPRGERDGERRREHHQRPRGPRGF